MKCPRCNRTATTGGTIQGVWFGPLCRDVVYRRQRVRESYGDTKRVIQICDVTGKEFYASPDSASICPKVLCAICRYNTKPYIAVTQCPLEVAANEKELAKWKS